MTTHFVAVKEDVTEQKLTQGKVLRAQRVESIGSLASGIARDLNSKLTPIVMCAPMLKTDVPDTERRELAQIIESSALRAGGIVKQEDCDPNLRKPHKTDTLLATLAQVLGHARTSAPGDTGA